MADAPHPDAVVLRFSPMGAERVLMKAAQEARRTGGKGLHTASVWADHARDNETRETLIARLLDVTEINGFDAKRNKKYWWCSSAAELIALGFSFIKDEYPGEPEEHYSVVLGQSPTMDDAQRFVDAFRMEKR